MSTDPIIGTATGIVGRAVTPPVPVVTTMGSVPLGGLFRFPGENTVYIRQLAGGYVPAVKPPRQSALDDLIPARPFATVVHLVPGNEPVEISASNVELVFGRPWSELYAALITPPGPEVASDGCVTCRYDDTIAPRISRDT